MRLLILFCCCCFSSPNFATPLQVITSFAILADMVENIGAAHVHVTSLIKTHIDPHSYEPTAKDIRAIQHAQLIVINGLNFEPWIQRLIDTADYHGEIVVASANIEPLNNDPHAWQDLSNGQAYVRQISHALIKVDPQHRQAYQQQSQHYLQQLQQLELWVKQQLAEIPAAQRKVISSHEAFAYFAKAYGVQFYAPQGINDQARPSAATVARLIRQMRQNHIKLLFVEHNADQRLLQQIAKEANGIIGGHLYAGSLTVKGGEADSYIQLFQHNVSTIKAGLIQTLAK